MDYEDNEYGENAVEDMMADYDYHINTGVLPELFDELENPGSDDPLGQG